jgi:hypothetical protein
MAASEITTSLCADQWLESRIPPYISPDSTYPDYRNHIATLSAVLPLTRGHGRHSIRSSSAFSCDRPDHFALPRAA